MNALLAIPQQEHFIFDSALDLNVRESFRAFGDTVFAGVQWTSWARDVRIWGARLGRYDGFFLKAGFFRAVPSNLRISDATEEVSGQDPLARISAGTLTVSTGFNYADPGRVLGAEFRLYNCADGTFASSLAPVTEDAEISASFTVANGSYLVWARAFDKGPEDENPTLAEAAMHDISAGEWGALKVVVGSGSFSIGSGVVPSPGCPLYAKPGADAAVTINAENQATHRVPFDALARSVSASCVTDTDITLADGSVDVAAGSQIIGGLRASRSGPQSALWVLNADLSARLLAMTEVFSNGLCECGKSDHHASDVAQSAGGTLFSLNECSLHHYAPDAPSLTERLPGSPTQNGGHPGGHSLRFFGGRAVFTTELLEKAPTDLGVFYYDRLIQRPTGTDVIGCGTIWHGPSDIEIYQGQLWGFRGSKEKLNDPDGEIVLDAIKNGVWSGSGVAYPLPACFWRQLKRRGSQLFWFGFNAKGHLDTNGYQAVTDQVDGTTDTPLCAVSDGSQIRFADFKYLVKRVTRCLDDGGGDTLLIVGNDTPTGQSLRNNGRALRVVELPSAGTSSSGATKLCSFWNAGAGEFRLSQSAFTAAGGDLAKLPTYFSWKAQSGSNGGGVWLPSATLPATPYLQTDLSGGALIKLKLHGTAPYDFAMWGLLCLAINADGSISGAGDGSGSGGGGGSGGNGGFEPGSTPTNAQEALDAMPEGTSWRVIQRETAFRESPLAGVQLTDLGVGQSLATERDIYPTLWGRVDATVALGELTSYTQLFKYGAVQGVGEAKTGVDVVVLVTPDSQPCRLPALGRRFN